MNTSIYDTLMPLVLASGSPRRHDFFASLGLEFRVEPSKAEEPAPLQGESPHVYAERMAKVKTMEVAVRHPQSAVIGADTVVAINTTILGKPKDREDGLRMLSMLSGKTHQVVTGCCIVMPGGKMETFHAATDVRMRHSKQAELMAYVATGEPDDKAGAYAIQGIGSFLVEHVHGSYTNVVGLPLARVLNVLLGWSVVQAKDVNNTKLVTP